MGRLSGWLVMALIGTAALIPLIQRVRAGKRASPQSKITSFHVMLGLATSGFAFAHTLAAILSLGSASAIGAGDLALAAGSLAFLVLIAHTGIGLQLRKPKLRKRGEKRRTHILTAITITVAALAHTLLLLRAG